MSDSDNGRVLIAFIWILTIGISIGSGVMAWNWIEPESFLGAVGFLFLWGILIRIGYFIATGIVALFGGMN